MIQKNAGTDDVLFQTKRSIAMTLKKYSTVKQVCPVLLLVAASLLVACDRNDG